VDLDTVWDSGWGASIDWCIRWGRDRQRGSGSFGVFCPHLPMLAPGLYGEANDHRKTDKFAVAFHADERAPGLIGRRQMPT